MIQYLKSIFLAILLKMTPVYKHVIWISIQRRHLKGLMPMSSFLQDVLSSELKNCKTFFTL